MQITVPKFQKNIMNINLIGKFILYELQGMQFEQLISFAKTLRSPLIHLNRT